MKKNLIIFAAVLAAASCSGKFVANGTVEGDKGNIEGAYVALIDGSGNELAVSDVTDGKFSLSAKADPTQVCGIVLQYDGKDEYESGYMVGLVPDKGKAEVLLAEDGSTVTGSRLTDALNDLQGSLLDTYMSAQDAIAKALEDGGDEAEAKALIDNRDKALIDLCMKAFEDNRDNAVGHQAVTMILGTANNGLSITEMKALVGRAAAFIQKDETVQMMIQQKESASDTAIGKKFKDIVGKTAEGETIKLSDYAGKGRYVLVDFWASWCGPCMNAVPKVRALLAKYENQGLDLVGVNCWERRPENGPAKAEEMNMTWPVIFAEDDQVDAYGVEAIPTLILFSPDGIILERLVGDSGIEEALAKYFE